MRLGKLGFVVGLGATMVFGQINADQVVAKSLAASGGAARFTAVKSQIFTGHLELPGGDKPTMQVWWSADPDRIRIEITTAEGKLVQVWDGAAAWQISPGATRAEAMTADQTKSVQDQAINGVELAANPAVARKLLGQGTMDGHDYYRIAFTLPTGDMFIQYFDSKTWQIFHEDYPGGSEDISDYRSVDGLALPYRFTQPQVTVVRDTVSLNPPIPATTYQKP